MASDLVCAGISGYEHFLAKFEVLAFSAFDEGDTWLEALVSPLCADVRALCFCAEMLVIDLTGAEQAETGAILASDLVAVDTFAFNLRFGVAKLLRPGLKNAASRASLFALVMRSAAVLIFVLDPEPKRRASAFTALGAAGFRGRGV